MLLDLIPIEAIISLVINMPAVYTSLQAFLDGLTGHLGSAAQYVAFHRAFTAIPLLGPVTHFINAPFGRFSVISRLNVNGNLAWVGGR